MNLPITGLYAALCGLIVVVLVLRIVGLRRKFRVGIGDGGQKPLAQAIRVHGNAVETMPIALILLAIFEANGGLYWIVHVFGAALVLGRLLHVLGLSSSIGITFGRFWGTVLTLLVIIGLAIANLLGFVASFNGAV
ncbi:MAPEG family protein [Permianibacter aggregans]|uniref:Glutathione S-transferase n=1 Tax=Permianibacter aggregans TaxID=1510150 RepID=A0A4R6UHS7_9GAMM|nr:MAPEG family protein [Permianibacter aggregans]QGX38468.1 hypothetical protein E2H98_01815 [Permianibacter aggregans]TDQ45586.1 hypothetical protein EV696_11954 [Permianibacter aggregans]